LNEFRQTNGRWIVDLTKHAMIPTASGFKISNNKFIPR